MKTIRIADAQVGDSLTWRKNVHVDPVNFVSAQFSGTVVEAPEVLDTGDLELMVTLSGGWVSTYVVPSTTMATVL